MRKTRIGLLLVAAVVGMLVINGSRALAAEHGHMVKVGKKGEVTLDKETKVGDLTLKPGRYLFQHRVEGEDHFVHFTEVTKENTYFPTTARGGEPKAHPGEVKCKLEPLTKKVEATTLTFDREDGTQRLVRAEIAGENVAHVF